MLLLTNDVSFHEKKIIFRKYFDLNRNWCEGREEGEQYHQTLITVIPVIPTHILQLSHFRLFLKTKILFK